MERTGVEVWQIALEVVKSGVQLHRQSVQRPRLQLSAAIPVSRPEYHQDLRRATNAKGNVIVLNNR
jgi:hypothetical protein